MSYSESHIEKDGQNYDGVLSADDFNLYMAVREAELIEKIILVLASDKRRRYLDFACGSGRILSRIAPHIDEVVAVDVSQNMMVSAKAKVPTATFHLADLTTENLDLGMFDLVSAFRFFGNAEDDLRHAALAALRERIANDGYLLLNKHRNPASSLARIRGNNQGMDLTYAKLHSLLRSHGFQISKRVPIGAWLLRHRWARRAIWDTALGRTADKLSSWAPLVPIAPDMLILARPV